MDSTNKQVLPGTAANGNTTITTTIAAEVQTAASSTSTSTSTGATTPANTPNNNNVKSSIASHHLGAPSSSPVAHAGAASAGAATSASASSGGAHKIIDNRSSRSRASHHPTIQIIGGTICNTVPTMNHVNMNHMNMNNMNLPMMMMMPPLVGGTRASIMPEMGGPVPDNDNTTTNSNNNKNSNNDNPNDSHGNVGAYTQVTKGIASTSPTSASKSKRRKCHFPGCQRTIKSQRHCQKHGAVVKKCKVDDCPKQAQGRHEGMCKRHWNEKYKPPKVKASRRVVARNGSDYGNDYGNGNGNGNSNTNANSSNTLTNLQGGNNSNINNGASGNDKNSTTTSPMNKEYQDKMLSQSTQQNVTQVTQEGIQNQAQQENQLATSQQQGGQEQPQQQQQQQQQQDLGPSVYDKIIPRSVAWKSGDSDKSKAGKVTTDDPSSSSSSSVMPLVEYLRDGHNLEPGWHRKQERLIRNFRPLSSVSEQLQPEEKQLILFETMLLSGTVYTQQQGISKDLAHAWGRERGFHTQLVNQMCGRRGDLSRKRRSDIGKVISEEEKARIRKKREENIERLNSEGKGITKQHQQQQQQQQHQQPGPQQSQPYQNSEPRVTVVTQENNIEVHQQAPALDEISKVGNNTSLSHARNTQYYPDSSTTVYFPQDNGRPV